MRLPQLQARTAAFSLVLGLCVLAAGVAVTVRRNLRDRHAAEELRRLENESVRLTQQGKPAQAIPLLKRSVEIRRRLARSDSREVAYSLGALARLYASVEEHGNACAAWQECIATFGRIGLRDTGDFATAVASLADMRAQLGQYRQALSLYRQARQVLEPLPRDRLYAIVLSHEALVRTWLAQYEQAERLYREALRVCASIVPRDNALCATIRGALASWYRNVGAYSKAEELYKRARDELSQAGAGHAQEYAEVLTAMAELYRVVGRCGEAEPLLREALRIEEEEAVGRRGAGYATVLNNLGLTYGCQGKHAQALSSIRAAVAIWKVTFGERHPSYALSIGNLAEAYTSLGMYDLAEPLYEESTALLQQSFGTDSLYYADSLSHLADYYERRGRCTEAADLYRRSLEIAEKGLGADHPLLARKLRSYSSLLRKIGRREEAAHLEARADAIPVERESPSALSLSSATHNTRMRSARGRRGHDPGDEARPTRPAIR